jgi:hypothetical protein
LEFTHDLRSPSSRTFIAPLVRDALAGLTARLRARQLADP